MLELADPGDVQTISYMKNWDRWVDNDTDLYMPLIHPGDTVINVGANIGFVALILAKLIGQSGRLIAIEPSPMFFLSFDEQWI